MLTLRNYQIEASNLVQTKDLIVADDCGLGKTVTAIDAAMNYSASNKLAPIFIVAPKSVVPQWVSAISRQAGANPFRIHVLSSDRTQQYNNDGKVYDLKLGLEAWESFIPSIGAYCEYCFVITHYEALVKHSKVLTKIDWGFLVIDEGHRIRNRKAQRTAAVKAIRAARKMVLTATPYDNKNPADLWSTLHWFDPIKFNSYWAFFEKHTAYKRIPNGNSPLGYVKTPIGIADKKAFAAELAPYMVRRTKADVAPELPERIEQTVEIPMLPKQAQLYKKIEAQDDLITVLEMGVEVKTEIVLEWILRLRQTLSFPEGCLGVSATPSAKLEWLAEWLEDHSEESVIIFSDFRETAEKIAKDFNLPLVIGGAKRPDLTGVKRLVGTIGAMGEGLDFPDIDTAIFIDRNWSSIQMTQAIDRIHRINSKNTKHILYLHTPGTVDDMLATALNEKLGLREALDAYLRGR